ncbi:MAG: GDSL-type esterase/lipase family protein [Planctomycetes bacterium]|nr:GDSL-type esterase/lipase family protein [Planctomycetota bacterium]
MAGALGLGSALLAGEVAVRVSGVTSSPRRHTRPGMLAADPELGWVLQPHYRGVHVEPTYEVPVSTNDLGFRTPAWDEARAAAEVRVLALGDSCTFGLGVGDDDTWPAQLEGALREGGVDAAVFNAGVSGYDTEQELVVLRRLVEVVRPTAVVVGWLPNDALQPSAEQLADIRLVDGHMVTEENMDRFLEWRDRLERRPGLRSSALYGFVRSRWKLLTARDRAREPGPGDGPIPDEVLARSQAALAEIVRESRAAGARPVVVLFPREEEVFDPAVDASHHARMAAFVAGLEAEAIDLAHTWREAPPGRAVDLYIPRDSVHLTPTGYRLVVDALLRLLEPTR